MNVNAAWVPWAALLNPLVGSWVEPDANHSRSSTWWSEAVPIVFAAMLGMVNVRVVYAPALSRPADETTG